jgi:hypothetical protein
MTVGEVCKRNVAIAVKNETIVDAANIEDMTSTPIVRIRCMASVRRWPAR